MKQLIASLAILTAMTTAHAGPPTRFKTAVVGPNPTAVCVSKTSILAYQQNRTSDPMTATAAIANCKTLASGAKVDVIYIFGDGIGDHVVQVHPHGSAKLGYALTSGFLITQEVGAAK